MKAFAAVLGALAVMVMAIVALAGFASSQQASPVAAGGVVDDIPPELLPIYQQAAAKTCGMPWSVLAAVGKTESDHDRSTLPGVHDGANYAGAMGPMQFMPATWGAMGVDADGDGVTNVYDPVDAIWSAARYLCHEGAGDPARLRAAILQYSGGDPNYVDINLGIAARYQAAADAAGAGASIVGDHALPIARSWFDQHPDWLTKPHHCCTPAIDIPVPVGTPVFAVAGGTAVRIDEPDGCGWGYQLAATDGNAYIYCHMSNPTVPSGVTVSAGELLGYSGGVEGAPGAGNSTGAHLHFGLRKGTIDFCPQSLLVALYSGEVAVSGPLLQACTD